MEETILEMKEASQNMMHILDTVLEFEKVHANKIKLKMKELNVRRFTANVIKAFAVQCKVLQIGINTNIAINIPEVVRADGFRLSGEYHSTGHFHPNYCFLFSNFVRKQNVFRI